MIKYVEENLRNVLANIRTEPLFPEAGTKVYLMHICNNVGQWGAGFSGVVSGLFPEAEAMFRKIASTQPSNNVLGCVEFCKITDWFTVVNLIAQNNVRVSRTVQGEDIPPIRYDALTKCLKALNEYITEHSVIEGHNTVICPLMGAGLAGGDWDTVAAIIEGTLDWPVVAYVLPNDKYGKALIEQSKKSLPIE